MNPLRRFSVMNFMTALAILLGIALLAQVWSIAGYGFDFTDEGFYLNSIAHPFDYDASVTLFGLAYHPWYLMLGGSIPALRTAGLLLTLVAGTWLAWIWLSRTFPDSLKFHLSQRLGLAIALGALSLLIGVVNGQWIPGPSYNTLTLQGLLIGATGLLLVDRNVPWQTMAGWLVMAVGAWLTFLAKPTSAALFVAIALAQIVVNGRWSFRLASIAVAGGLLLMVATALVHDQSVQHFIERYVKGFELVKLLGSGHGLGRLFRLDGLPLGLRSSILLVLLAGGMGVLFLVLMKPEPAWHKRLLLTTGIGIAGAAAGLHHFSPAPMAPLPRSLMVLAATLGIVIAAAVSCGLRSVGRPSRSDLVNALSLIGLSYAYALGTNLNYWIPIATASIFAVLGLLTLLKPLATQPGFPRALLGVAVALQMTLLVLLEGAIANPHRQSQPLRQNNVAATVARTRLLVAPVEGSYLAQAHSIAAAAGFSPGTTMLDLTGASPGLVYALDARSVGLAWLLGGYQGSARYVARALEHARCGDLVAAWVLAAPDGPRRLPPEILNGFGADLDTDYQRVGKLMAPGGILQELYKPVRESATGDRACETKRAAK